MTKFITDQITSAACALDRELDELIRRAEAGRAALRAGTNLAFGPSNTSGLLGRSATDVEHVAGRLRALVEVATVSGVNQTDLVHAYTIGGSK
jgi:hypothetical protein